MSAKKVLSFLVCRSAFTQRNVTSIMLVFVFFGVYVAAGGKITTSLPRPSDVAVRGEARDPAELMEQAEERSLPDLSAGESKDVLGIAPSEERQARREEVNRRGRLFTPEEVEQATEETIDTEGLVKGKELINRREQWRLERAEKKPQDSLSAIEERLKIRRR